MYAKYRSAALVLRSRSVGESDRTFTLYTQDFGLIRARASGVRSEKSRMRYVLQDYARAQVSLVRGTRGWRVAGAASDARYVDARAVPAFARIARLVERLVGGEEKNEYLFAALSDAHAALLQTSREGSATIELVCVARVLFALGYLSSEALETALFTHTAYEGEHLKEAELLRERLLTSVNRAMAETHL